MSLLIQNDDLFTIDIYFKEENGSLEVIEAPSPEDKFEKFSFKRPNWQETRIVSSASVLVDANTGKAIIDPFKYMDLRLKLLLKDWTLKDQEGNKLPITYDNIDKLHPLLVQHLFGKVEEFLVPIEQVTVPKLAKIEG